MKEKSMERIIYNCSTGPHYTEILHDFVEDHPLEFVLNITIDLLMQSRKRGVVFQNVHFWDAMQGIYDPPGSVLSPKLLNDLSPYLLTTLKMMDRLPYGKTYRFDDRVELYFRQVKYWSYILDEHKIDCYISIGLPHEVFDYVIYCLCKIKGIKVVFLMVTQIPGYQLVIDDIEKQEIRLLDPSKDNLLQNSLSPFMERYVAQLTTQYKPPFYFEIGKKKIDARLTFLARFKNAVKVTWKHLLEAKKYFSYTLKDWSLPLYFYARCSTSAEVKLNKFYNSIATLPDYSKKYIFVPLHYQPECTTSPQGGVFVFQEIMIEMLLNALPEGVLLYVKEHPAQTIAGRTEDFYKKFISNPKIVWIKKEVPSIDLIKNALTVATITGTAAWEALFQGKRVMVFGKVFFQYAPGVFRIPELSECREAIKEIMQSNEKVDINALRNFLARFEQNAIRAWVDPGYREVSEIGDEENLRNIREAFKKI